ncbi:unnamed protein product, partial [Ceratitis capitata]
KLDEPVKPPFPRRKIKTKTTTTTTNTIQSHWKKRGRAESTISAVAQVIKRKFSAVIPS